MGEGGRQDDEQEREQFLLGELRQIRTARGVTQEELAKKIQWAASTVGMIETGARKPPPKFWPAVDAALDTGGTLSRLATRLDTPRWRVEWTRAEAEATLLRSYQSTVIPGLLQTESYARALLTRVGKWRTAEVERLLAERMARQAILTRDDPPAPAVYALVDEGALRRPVGGARVMREQLHALTKAVETPNVWIGVVPLAAGAHAGLDGPFVLATDAEGRVTGYLDHQLKGQVVDGANEIATIHLAWETVRGQALPEQQSLQLIREVADSWI
jgi:transcriptional regulator with XRE-family HTH domain